MLDIQGITLEYNNNLVLEVDKLHLQKGEIGCILGPSGSGKSSFLRAISGLLTPSSGRISINQTVVSDGKKHVSVENRQVGMVFQDLCLFPHMTVKDNIAYGLHKFTAQQKAQRIDEVLQLVGLSEFASRYPFELSGGQQQRVAIARAIAPQPQLMLMDEPFSSLDPELREQLASDLRKLLKSLNITALVVTHDQHEAFALADKIAVFDKLRCQQWDTAYKLYHQPASLEVASFIGEGCLILGEVVQNNEITGQIAIDTVLGRLNQYASKPVALKQKVSILVRPDDILLDESSDKTAFVVDKQFRGAHIMYKLKFQDTLLSCLTPSHHNCQVGESFGIKLDIQHLVYFIHD
ncbi:ABC transporter ATP-binding protein [Glaciecola sp. 1036]|uniref:ABC transporter ATP-binding protein n=1 Tax=Alteromonadaceae TaxID=72275 RepID=UPI003D055C22